MTESKIFRVHIDTEFTDFTNSDLISLGMVASDGSEFYVENMDHIKAWVSPWVIQNIYPMLNYHKFGKTRNECSVSAWEWISDLECDKVIISSDHRVDMKQLSDLFNGDKHPKMLRFENIIENIYYDCDAQCKAAGGSNADYDAMAQKLRAEFSQNFQEYLEDNCEQAHYAISDARANKYAYELLVKKYGIRI